MLTIITLPENFVTDISSNASSLISDFSGPITLVLGVLLTGVLISLLIGALKK